MKKRHVAFAGLGALAGLAGVAAVAFVMSDAAPVVPYEAGHILGQPAPDFTLPDANGRPVRLASYRGKTVVLEWHNPGCPSVKKHYGSGNMQRTQVAAAKDGVVWLSINSGAPGKQGHMDGAEAREFLAEAKAKPAAYLLDPGGTVGRSYDAKATPHLFIVNADGALVYAGGIDDKPTTSTADIAGARNHVLAALAEIKAGKPVSVASSRPYGCSVKFANG